MVEFLAEIWAWQPLQMTFVGAAQLRKGTFGAERLLCVVTLIIWTIRAFPGTCLQGQVQAHAINMTEASNPLRISEAHVLEGRPRVIV